MGCARRAGPTPGQDPCGDKQGGGLDDARLVASILDDGQVPILGQVGKTKEERTMAWGIIMTGLMLASMLGLVIFEITRGGDRSGQGLPVTEPEGALARPVEQGKAA